MTRNRPPSPQTLSLLSVLLQRPVEWRHGYDLAKASKLSSGTLYPLLIRLHDRGLLDAQWIAAEPPGRPARHAYRLSATGLDYARTLQVEGARAAALAMSAQPA